MSDFEQYKSLCQVRECGKPAVVEIGMNNTPTQNTYKEWIAFCRPHRNQYVDKVKLAIGPRFRIKVR